MPSPFIPQNFTGRDAVCWQIAKHVALFNQLNQSTLLHNEKLRDQYMSLANALLCNVERNVRSITWDQNP